MSTVLSKIYGTQMRTMLLMVPSSVKTRVLLGIQPSGSALTASATASAPSVYTAEACGSAELSLRVTPPARGRVTSPIS